MQNKTVEGETRIYLYDLMNTAKEHGFKSEDSWELGLATTAEADRILRNYHPAIVHKVYPEILLDVFHLTKARLNQPLNPTEETIDKRTVQSNELTHIVAFNPKRQRT